MATWRDDLIESIKSKAERERERAERDRKRLEAALIIGDEAMAVVGEGLRFVHAQLREKDQPAELEESEGKFSLRLRDQALEVALARDTGILTVNLNDGKPREFDFAKDRHLAAKDVEEYAGRRAVELARAAQKSDPW